MVGFLYVIADRVWWVLKNDFIDPAADIAEELIDEAAEYLGEDLEQLDKKHHKKHKEKKKKKKKKKHHKKPHKKERKRYVLNATSIWDEPRFQHRGLLIDTARHFLPVEVIEVIG